MDPIQLWLLNKKKTPSAGTPTGAGTFGGAASGASVAPVQPTPATFTPTPTMPIGGYTPPWGDLIKSTPEYISGMAAGQKDVSQAAAARRAALQQLAIRYGGLPSGLQDAYGDIDQGTLELAGKNPYSEKARLDRSYTEGVEAFKKALAARGALQSGETGYGLAQADLARGEREYDAGNQFANAAQGVINDYVGVESRVRGNEANLLSQAQASVYANPANRPVDAYDAPLIAGSVEQYGEPLYQGRDGKMYTAAGVAFDPPVSAGASLAPAGSLAGAGATSPTGQQLIWITDPVTGQLVQVPASAPGSSFYAGGMF